MTHVTCRLTAKNRDQLRNLTLGSSVGDTFTFFISGRELNYTDFKFSLSVATATTFSKYLARDFTFFQ